MLDINMLRLVKTRKEYNQIVPSVPKGMFDPKTQRLLEDFGTYFKKFKDHEKIDLELFIPAFRRWHPSVSSDDMKGYEAILRNVQDDLDPETKEVYLNDLHSQALATKLANDLEVFNLGELADNLPFLIEQRLETYKRDVGLRVVQWNDTAIEDLLQVDLEDGGLMWRSTCLRESMRGLRPGDFGIIAGRPDRGKTSFIASEVTYLASQLPEDKVVLWFNNEGTSDKIVKRIWQAALGVPLSKMLDMMRDGTLRSEYKKAIGRIDRIRVVDCHGWHVGQVQAAIEAQNPAIVVFDMLDNVKWLAQGEKHQTLEELYQWGREVCARYGMIGIATSQISGDGENMRFPTMDALKDSKTGKQGACEFIIMIGHVNNPGMEDRRFIGVPKNKLHIEGKKKNPEAEMWFRGDTCRFVDIETEYYTKETNDDSQEADSTGAT